MTNFVLRECGDKRKEVSIARKFIKKFVTPKKNVDLKEIIQDRMNRIRDKMNDVKIDLEPGIEELKEYAKRKELQLEVLFHPGIALKEEIGKEFNHPEANEFYLSSNRQVEYEAMMGLNI